MRLRLLLLLAGSAVLLPALACGENAAPPGILAIAVNQDSQAQPRLAFYAGVPGRDSFTLPAGNYVLIAIDMVGGVAVQERTATSGEDAAAAALAGLDPPTPSEDTGRLNREAMRHLFLFFARFNGAQLQLEDLLTEGHTRPAPASPDDLGAIQILGEERPQGRLLGIRDWESEMASWGRMLELGLRAIQAELPAGLLDSFDSPFADVVALVSEWRDRTAVDRRAFLEVVGQMSAERRVELYQSITTVFEQAVSQRSADFYGQVERGELDDEMWVIANFAYENDRPADGPSYGEIARSQGLEPGRPYFDRWLRQSPSAWSFVWLVSADMARRARLPEEVLALTRPETAMPPAVQKPQGARP